MFRLMKFEEECQQTYLSNLCLLTPQEQKLDEVKERYEWFPSPTNENVLFIFPRKKKVMQLKLTLNIAYNIPGHEYNSTFKFGV